MSTRQGGGPARRTSERRHDELINTTKMSTLHILGNAIPTTYVGTSTRRTHQHDEGVDTTNPGQSEFNIWLRPGLIVQEFAVLTWLITHPPPSPPPE
jgi:hypothetical protein